MQGGTIRHFDRIKPVRGIRYEVKTVISPLGRSPGHSGRLTASPGAVQTHCGPVYDLSKGADMWSGTLGTDHSATQPALEQIVTTLQTGHTYRSDGSFTVTSLHQTVRGIRSE
jgi:hypothetical protein